MPSPLTPTYKSKITEQSVDVIIISHNYGKYLKECIESLLKQTVLPFEAIVVADDCNDDTVTIATEYGLKCYSVDHKHVHLSRKTGFDLTRSPYVIFLDADDWLKPTYIEATLNALLKNTDAAICTSHLDIGNEVRYHEPVNIEKHNWLHAGSMVRRTALIGSECFERLPPVQTHCDWYIWRSIIRQGWTATSINNPLYFYRQHATSMMVTHRKNTYYEVAALSIEPITVVIPICRSRHWSRLFDWLVRNLRSIDKLLIIDSSDISQTIKREIATLDIADYHYIRRPSTNGLADLNRVSNDVAYLEVQETMLKIYSNLRYVTTEYMYVLEDDVLPPDGAVASLLQNMDTDVAGISGIVRSRFAFHDGQGRIIAGHDFIKAECPLQEQQGILQVGYTGFGSLILRKSAMLEVKPFTTGNYDMQFCKDIKNAGWKWLLDFNVRCIHG